MELSDIYSRIFLRKLASAGEVWSEPDLEVIRRAIVFCKRRHDGLYRKSGEPYYSHPIQVAQILLGYTTERDIIVAAILHDVLEDTETDLRLISYIFGKEVAFLVDTVSTIDTGTLRVLSSNGVLRKNTYSQKALLVKLADRLHNIITLHHIPAYKMKHKVNETLRLYVPLAQASNLHDLARLLEMETLRYLPIISAMEEKK